MTSVATVERLQKRYGERLAVDDLSFEVGAGQVFGLVGPNGAGKTTTVECLEGLTRPDKGKVTVFGMDPMRDRVAAQQRLGVLLQGGALQPRLRVGEAFKLFESFYAAPTPGDAIVAKLGLSHLATSRIQTLSGGERQKVFLGLALVGDPDLLILDELTTGLDVQAKRAMWALVRDLQGEGKSILLITHQMDEAERLCDRVAVLNSGRLVAIGSPTELVEDTVGGGVAVLSFDAGASVNGRDVRPDVTGLHGWEPLGGGRVRVLLGDASAANECLRALKAGGRVATIESKERASLEDVFVALTSRGAQ